MKIYLAIICISLVPVKLTANQNTYPIELVYKHLINKYSNSKNGDLENRLDLNLSDYLRCVLQLNEYEASAFYNNSNFNVYDDYRGDPNQTFKIDTIGLNKILAIICEAKPYSMSKKEIMKINGLQLTNFKSLLSNKSFNFFITSNYNNNFELPDTILYKLYTYFKKEANKNSNAILKTCLLLKLEIFISHNLNESKPQLFERINLLERSINTTTSNTGFAEIYYNFGDILENANEIDMAFNFYYRSYLIGLKSFNLHSKKSHLKVLESTNKDYTDLLNSKNSSYNFDFGNNNHYSRISELFSEPISREKNSILDNVFINFVPRTKFDIEYAIMIFNTIYSIATTNHIDVEKPNVNLYALLEIINLLDYARTNDITLDPNVISNSLTNIASHYWFHGKSELHVYCSFAAFKTFKLEPQNFNEYTNLYKIFCDVSSNSGYTGYIVDRIINNGIYLFKTCNDKSAYCKMLSSCIVYNIRRGKYDVAKVVFDNLYRTPTFYEINGNSIDLLKMIDYNYFNLEKIGRSYSDKVKDSILKSSNLDNYHMDDINKHYLSEMKFQYNFIENIKSASSEVHQLDLKRSISDMIKQVNNLNESITIRKQEIEKQNKSIGKLKLDSVILATKNNNLELMNIKAQKSLNKKIDDVKHLEARNKWITKIAVIFAIMAGILAVVAMFFGIGQRKQRKLKEILNDNLEISNKNLLRTNKDLLAVTEEKITATKQAALYKSNFFKEIINFHPQKSGLPKIITKLNVLHYELSQPIISSQKLHSSMSAIIDMVDYYFQYMENLIQNSKRETIPLKDEIANCQQFIDFINLSSNKKIQFDTTGIAGFEDIKIPSNILIPFVENSVNYAFQNNIVDNKISVVIETQKERSIIFKDNGNGKVSQNIKKGSGVSLEAIKQYLDNFNLIKDTIYLFDHTHEEYFDNLIENGQIKGVFVKIKNI